MGGQRTKKGTKKGTRQGNQGNKKNVFKSANWEEREAQEEERLKGMLIEGSKPRKMTNAEVSDDTKLLIRPQDYFPEYKGIVIQTTHAEAQECSESLRKTAEEEKGFENHFRVVSGDPTHPEKETDEDRKALPDNCVALVGRRHTNWDEYEGMLRTNITKRPYPDLLALEGQEWKDWCNDFLIYICLRNVRHGDALLFCVMDDVIKAKMGL